MSTSSLLVRLCKMQSEIKKILPDFNCRMFEPYHKLLAALLPPERITHIPEPKERPTHGDIH
jgi:hypothetical protein